MDYSAIDHYMEAHDFLNADKKKIHDFIKNENVMRVGKQKFICGYLTRTQLYLYTGYGALEEYSRILLGVQINFR